MAVEAGRAYVELVPKLDPSFSQKVGAQIGAVTKGPIAKASQALKGFGASAIAMGKKLTLGLTTPLAAAGVAAFKFASDESEALNKVDVVFGKTSDVVKMFSQNAAKNLGVSRAEALEATGTFGNLFRAMKIGEPNAARMSTSLVTLASDLASFNNASPEDTLLALRSGLTGEIEPLRKFGVNLTQARIEAEALRLGLIKEGEALDAGAKAQAAYSLIMQDTALAQGDFARTSDGAANKTRILIAQAKDLAASIGRRLLPVGEKLMGWVSDWLARFDELSPKVQNIIIGVGIFAAALGPLALLIGAVATVLGVLLSPVTLVTLAILALAAGIYLLWTRWDEVVTAIKDHPAIAALAVIFAPFLAAIVGVIAVIKNWPAIWAKIGPPIKATIDGIRTQVANLADWVRSHWEQIKEAVRNVMTVIGAIVMAVWQVIRFVWEAGGDDILNFITDVFDAIVRVVQDAVDIVRNIIEFFLNILTGEWGAAWDNVVAILRSAWDAIVAVVRLAWEAVKGIIGLGLSLLSALWSLAWSGIVAAVSGAWSWITGVVAGGVSSIVGFIRSIPGRLAGFVGTVFDGLKNAARNAADGALSFFTSLPGRILGVVGSIRSAAVAVGKKIIDGIGEGLSQVASFASDLGAAVAEAVKDAINTVIGLLNDAIPNSIGWGLFSVDVPDNPIPTLHTGGIVPGPPGADVPAILRAGERVLSTDDAKDYRGEGMVNHFYGIRDERDVAEELDWLRFTGGAA